MGTNYFHIKECCPHCGRHDDDAKLHIGKSSYGWVFSLRVYPHIEINSLDDWRECWQSGKIIDEYGRQISATRMENIITERGRDLDWATHFSNSLYGNGGEPHFHRVNKSQRGPNGLLRHRVDGDWCSGHGDGTWDYIVRDFS